MTDDTRATIIPFTRIVRGARRPDPDANLRCVCGSEWWRVDAVIVNAASGLVTGYGGGLRCRSCGAPAPR